MIVVILTYIFTLLEYSLWKHGDGIQVTLHGFNGEP